MLGRLFILLAVGLSGPGCLTFITELQDDDDVVSDDDDAVDDDDAGGDDADMDGWTVEEGDCADDDPTRHPEAEELCDGIDSNCDGLVDSDLTGDLYYLDNDGDGFGNPDESLAIRACTETEGYSPEAGDCADNLEDVHPDADEVCNGRDDDCDGRVDSGVLVTLYIDRDGDEHGAGPVVGQGCPGPGYADTNDDCNDDDAGVWEDLDEDVDGDQWDRCDGDCNDSSFSINPGATDVCDGLDNDCSGVADDNFKRVGVIYDGGQSAALDLKGSLDQWGYCATLYSASGISETETFVDESMLFVAHDAGTPGSPWTGPVTPFTQLNDSCKPLFGLGDGGLTLFDAISQTGFPTNLKFANQGSTGNTLVNPGNSTSSYWNTPNQVAAAGANYVRIYFANTWTSIDSDSGSFDVIATAYNSPSIAMVLRENQCGSYWFWGWNTPVQSATLEGQNLFENLVHSAIGPP
jgi:hypothetical protein